MTINIYSPLYPQCSGYILADVEGLEKLKAAVEQALETGRSELDDFDSDGEGYSIGLLKLSLESFDEIPSASPDLFSAYEFAEKEFNDQKP